MFQSRPSQTNSSGLGRLRGKLTVPCPVGKLLDNGSQPAIFANFPLLSDPSNNFSQLRSTLTRIAVAAAEERRDLIWCPGHQSEWRFPTRFRRIAMSRVDLYLFCLESAM